MTLVAGIDSGTKACKGVVRDMATGRLIRTGAAAHPQDATVAQRWTSLHAAVTAAGGADDVSAIAITGAPTSAIALDDHARPIATLVGDARTAAFLITGVGAAVFAQRTGAVPSADTALSGLRRLHETDHDTAAREIGRAHV